jgi:hypothetical protein
MVVVSCFSALATYFIFAKIYSEAFLMASKSSGFDKPSFFNAVKRVIVFPILDSTNKVLSIYFLARTLRIDKVFVPSAFGLSNCLAMSSRISIISSTVVFSSFYSTSPFFSMFKILYN